jgi:hypothetical protein
MLLKEVLILAHTKLDPLYVYSTRENTKTSAKESDGNYKLQQHKTWFDEEYSKLLDKSKQAKFQ